MLLRFSVLLAFLFPHLAAAQTVSGTVVDVSGNAIPGVLVVSKGFKSSVSDESGVFHIPASGEVRIQFSHLAFLKTDTVLSEGNHRVVLKPAILEGSDVVVTATRTERDAESVSVPVSVVSKAQIQSGGQVRLANVLAEQTGLQLVSNFGTGIQVQGFDADYTLIMIDGEPVIGRQAGTLDLRRLPVANIKRIETIKGPSSALWGSDALAGVINIITDSPTQNRKGSAQIRAASFGSYDGSLSLEQATARQGTSVFVNLNQTDGYDLDTVAASQTSPSFRNASVQIKQRVDFSPAIKFAVQGRFFTENLDDSGALGLSGEAQSAQSNRQKTREFSLNPVLKTVLAPGMHFTARHYLTKYQNSYTNLEAGSTQTESDFEQSFSKSEGQLDFAPGANHWITLGSGYFQESVNASRYVEKPAFSSFFSYAQHEWRISPKAGLTYGARLDRHSEYSAQLSPKVSGRYQFSEKLTFRASVGRGFKAPDFRQLLLGFTNAVAGYSIYGSVAVADAVRDLQTNGQILQLYFDPSTIGTMRAESSWALNSGFDWDVSENLQFRVNGFYNRVTDMIDVRQIALKTNGSAVYTYVNLNAVFTRGFDLETRWNVNESVRLQLGYQFLDAKDLDVIEQIRAGKKFRSTGTNGEAERVTEQEYGGLFNRSRHMANAALTFQPVSSKVSGTLRAQYRGRYGMGDLNRNDILDTDSEYASPYLLVNASVMAETVGNMRLTAGVDNLFNYTNPAFQPFLAGRILYLTLNIPFNSTSK